MIMKDNRIYESLYKEFGEDIEYLKKYLEYYEDDFKKSAEARGTSSTSSNSDTSNTQKRPPQNLNTKRNKYKSNKSEFFDISIKDEDVLTIIKTINRRINPTELSENISQDVSISINIGDHEDNNAIYVPYTLTFEWDKILKESLIQKSRYRLKEAKASMNKNSSKKVLMILRAEFNKDFAEKHKENINSIPKEQVSIFFEEIKKELIDYLTIKKLSSFNIKKTIDLSKSNIGNTTINTDKSTKKEYIEKIFLSVDNDTNFQKVDKDENGITGQFVIKFSLEDYSSKSQYLKTVGKVASDIGDIGNLSRSQSVSSNKI